MTNVQFSGVPFSDVLRSTLEKNVHFSETLYHYAIRHVRTWKKNYNKRNKIEKQCKQLVNNEIKKRLQIGYGILSASTSSTLSFETKCGVFPTLRKQPTFHDANTGFPAK